MKNLLITGLKVSFNFKMHNHEPQNKVEHDPKIFASAVTATRKKGNSPLYHWPQNLLH